MIDHLNGQSKTFNNLVAIANRFKPDGQIVNIQQYGSGNINNTFLVTLDLATEPLFILQRLNTKVFCQPKLVMSNICIFSDYVGQKLHQSMIVDNRRWEVPRVLLTKDAQNHWLENDGSFWRAMSFIVNSQSFDQIQDPKHGQEIGYGLGMFHHLISDLPVEQLADTLAGFHITPSYLQHYDRILTTIDSHQSPEVNYCLKLISARSNLAHVLENAKVEGKLKMRTIHGDPKINNIMIDRLSGQAVAMIDLDTVKPGLIHYDIGDCLRSGCNPLGEETPEWEQVSFEPELAQVILQGYLAVAQDFLTENDYDYIYDSIRLLTFELGLRFFTDYLAGNVYFKAGYAEHNLARALVQFKLMESIESQSGAIGKIIQDMR